MQKSPAKKTPLPSNKAKPVKASDSDEVTLTPTTKRAAVKRKLVNEATDLQSKEADLKKGIQLKQISVDFHVCNK